MTISRLPIAFVQLRCYCHSTEDKAKVEKAISTILGKVWERIKPISWQHHDGYFGNTIESLSLKFENKSEVAQILQEIFAKMRAEDRDEVAKSLTQRLDKDNNLYLRFDKQAAFLGDICVGAEDTIRLQIKFSLPRKQREKTLEVAIGILRDHDPKPLRFRGID